jgi:hypothetical protein
MTDALRDTLTNAGRVQVRSACHIASFVPAMAPDNRLVAHHGSALSSLDIKYE